MAIRPDERGPSAYQSVVHGTKPSGRGVSIQGVGTDAR